MKYPDPNEQVPESKAPRLDLRKKLFLCGNVGCKHDVRDHGAVPNPSVGNTAGQCKIPSCKCRKYKFTGKVDFEEEDVELKWRGKKSIKAKPRAEPTVIDEIVRMHTPMKKKKTRSAKGKKKK